MTDEDPQAGGKVSVAEQTLNLITAGGLSEVPAGLPEGIPSLSSPARPSRPWRALTTPLEAGLPVWSPRH